MKFYYGINGYYSDITSDMEERFKTNDIYNLRGTNDEMRFRIFVTDPCPGVLKHILAIDNNGNKHIYPTGEKITVHDDYIYDILDIRKWWNVYGKYFYPEEEQLKSLNNKLKLYNGTFDEEYEEQLLTLKFLDRDAKVLELGSNIGRNTITIATILNDISNLVTLEPSKIICNCLRYNCDTNNLYVNIENKALSYRKLIQRDWTTIPSDILLDGYNEVDTITFEELEEKYKIKFNTIVADCEGALYYILVDRPNILNNINTLILENDYDNVEHKYYVEKLLKEKGFKKVYSKECKLEICLEKFPECVEDFYTVWKK